MIKTEKFHHYLRNKRMRLGYTQTTLANVVQVATSTISHIEAGEYTRYPLEKVHRLAKALNEDKDKFSALWIEAILGSQKEKLYKKIYSIGSE